MKNQAHLFSLPKDLHYLNCAYMSPLAKSVEAAGLAGVRGRINPTQVSATDFFQPADEARKLFAQLINADQPENVVIIPAVSYAMSVIAINLSLTKGENVIVAGQQFPSNVYPWRRLCKEAGATLITVNPPAEFPHGKAWNKALLEAITPETSLVALAPVHWADGTIFDLEAIGKKAKSVGAAFVIDGTQSVGARAFDVKKVQADAVVCASYKWMMGTYGLGVAWLGDRFKNGIPLEEGWIVRKDSENFGGLVDYGDDYQPGMLRYDVGERSSFVLMPMLIAGLKLVLELSPAEISQYCAEISRDFLTEIKSLGFLVEDDAWRSDHLFGIRLPAGGSLDKFKVAIQELNISVSFRGESIRVAPNVYNTAENFDQLLEALKSSIK